MGKDDSLELLPGTLELLILKTLTLEKLHLVAANRISS